MKSPVRGLTLVFQAWSKTLIFLSSREKLFYRNFDSVLFSLIALYEKIDVRKYSVFYSKGFENRLVSFEIFLFFHKLSHMGIQSI